MAACRGADLDASSRPLSGRGAANLRHAARLPLELVASEPLIQDPIAIDWDPAGRLWAIELPGYMRDIKASGENEPIGRIVVLEDSNGDGAMDRRTVFADGLIQPLAMKVLEQGVLVGEPPNIWLMRDTNGDLRSDRKDLVAAGYGRRETNVEVNANALLWGLDNRIHMSGTGADMVLRYVDRTFQVQRSLSRGQWGATAGRRRPDLSQPQRVRAARGPGGHAVLRPQPGPASDSRQSRGAAGSGRQHQRRLAGPSDPGNQPRLSAGHPAGGWHARGLHRRMRANRVSGRPAAGRVAWQRLRRRAHGERRQPVHAVADDGTTLRARKAYQGAEFLSSTDERFRPVYLSNAPDGTLYVVDIYRGIIQHHAYITEYLRDQIASRALEQPIGLGRIYRVVHDSTVRDRTTLPAKAPSSQLVGLLSHPSGWWRDTAQRLLVERGDQSVAPALTALVETAPDWRTRVHALWTLDGLNGVDHRDGCESTRGFIARRAGGGGESLRTLARGKGPSASVAGCRSCRGSGLGGPAAGGGLDGCAAAGRA